MSLFSHRFFDPFKSPFSFLSKFVFAALLMTLSILLSVNMAHCFDRSFAWDANTESNLAGYYIYYKNGAPGGPYNGIGAVEGDSPVQIPLASLSDPANPEYTLHGLSDGKTFSFVATAYDIDGIESNYSNVLCFGNACGESDGGGGCFIATAAFGSNFEKHVQLLRRFRDHYLMPHSIGRAFINVYYRYSPPIANFIADHDTLRMLVRWVLLPTVGLSWMFLHLGVLPTMLILILVGSTGWLCARKIKFRRSTTDN